MELMKVINHNLTEEEQRIQDEIKAWNLGLRGNGHPRQTLNEEMNMDYSPSCGIQTGQCAVPGLNDVKYKMDTKEK